MPGPGGPHLCIVLGQCLIMCFSATLKRAREAVTEQSHENQNTHPVSANTAKVHNKRKSAFSVNVGFFFPPLKLWSVVLVCFVLKKKKTLNKILLFHFYTRFLDKRNIINKNNNNGHLNF